MAGIGVKLQIIYNKNTIASKLVGFGYSTAITIAPLFLIIGTVFLMQILLGVDKLGYLERELFSSTVLYTFIFSLLTTAPLNAVLSRYLSDVIYNETYSDILPCYFFGLALNIGLSCLLGIPFCIYELVVGKIAPMYVFAGYCMYVALVFIFYTMLYLSICKAYQKITAFFLIGAVVTVVLSILLVYLLHMEQTFSMLLSLATGFIVIGSMELGQVMSYFRTSSGKYREVFQYIIKYRKLIVTNTLYILGLYVHNFAFWTSDLCMEVKHCFISMPTYDMASGLGMLTNILASLIFITKIEMNFNAKYKAYSEAVIGGRGMDIELAQRRMFRQLSNELLNLVCIQFIISIAFYFLCVIVLPRLGFGGLTMQIYPCLAAGYFILFIMYAAIIFLYYFNDLTGAVVTSVCFCVTTYLGSRFATTLSPTWYGIGLVMGSFVGFCVAYYYLRRMEKQLEVHIFCVDSILKRGAGSCPSNRVFHRAKKK